MSPLLLIIVALCAALIGLFVVRHLFARRQWLYRRVSGDHVVLVRERNGKRELVLQKTMEVAQTRQSCADPLQSGHAYTDGFQLCKLFAPDFERVLFLGAGGAIGPRQFVAMHENVLVDVVENDPIVIDAARLFFGFAESPRLNLHCADAQTFLSSPQPFQYDIMVVDLCDAFGIPSEVTTRSFFQSAGRSLAPAGVLCMNLLGSDAADGLVMRAFANARQVFGAGHSHLFAVPNKREEVPVSQGWQNWLVFATGGQSLVSIDDVVRSSPQLDTAMTPMVSAVAHGYVAAPPAGTAARRHGLPTPAE